MSWRRLCSAGLALLLLPCCSESARNRSRPSAAGGGAGQAQDEAERARPAPPAPADPRQPLPGRQARRVDVGTVDTRRPGRSGGEGRSRVATSRTLSGFWNRLWPPSRTTVRDCICSPGRPTHGPPTWIPRAVPPCIIQAGAVDSKASRYLQGPDRPGARSGGRDASTTRPAHTPLSGKPEKALDALAGRDRGRPRRASRWSPRTPTSSRSASCPGSRN